MLCRMATPKLYAAWFCPYAQRAWIAMLYKGVNFEYVETNPYVKSPEWLAISPLGLVPAVTHNGHSIYESNVCVEYIDEMWPEGNSIMPCDPYRRAVSRLWMDKINKKMCTHFYALLMKQTAAEREEAAKDLLKSIEAFTDAMSDKGPFFFGDQIGAVDIAWFPWAQRDFILKHYRSFSIPSNGKFARYQTWLAAVKELPSVKATVQPEDKLLQIYQRYADSTAKTLVADAVRAGKSADSIIP